MPNQFEFTTPIEFEPITHCSVAKATDVNDTTKSITLMLELWGTGVKIPEKVALTITNGSCEKLEIVAEPTTHMSTFRVVTVSSEGLNTAFDQVMYAYLASGQGLTGVLDTLGDLGLIPPGTAS